jgi:hypothetical protein
MTSFSWRHISCCSCCYCRSLLISQVMYVHQSRVNFKGTPNDFFQLAQSFAAQKGRPRGDLAQIVTDLGLEPGVLDQHWSELSVSCWSH